MGGIFFALVFAGWVPTALLVLGLGLAILRHGALRARPGMPHRPGATPRLQADGQTAKPSTFS